MASHRLTTSLLTCRCHSQLLGTSGGIPGESPRFRMVLAYILILILSEWNGYLFGVVPIDIEKALREHSLHIVYFKRGSGRRATTVSLDFSGKKSNQKSSIWTEKRKEPAFRIHISESCVVPISEIISFGNVKTRYLWASSLSWT
ncbi:hypothetical protein K438DRAFT_1763810 [Mycena galopus ATCC 62051]|nr:hypothetical protein K438DRAFT_1763810 [Mycena galopus ATCC 62051]